MQADIEAKDELLDWTLRQAEVFGKEVFVGKHRLLDHCRFSDDALMGLIERHPREQLQVFCSGTDPRRFIEDWHLVDASKASPSEIMAALAKGRLWVNLQRVDLSPELGPLVNGLYDELRKRCHGFEPFGIQASLFISSPGAIVYYHADAIPNLLWHLRGTKRIWVYPAQDVQLVPQPLMEDIFADAVDELPYCEEFDKSAGTYDIRPGDVASWPQNAPHRVHNISEINVSLTSAHWTAASERRKTIYLSNRYFRRGLKLHARSTSERGLAADIKCLTYRVCNRLGLVSERITEADAAYSNRGRGQARFCIDAEAPLGIRRT